ncbi:MAG: hypothetical protein HYS73_00620 [Parcubacteria group bacterium]|nr:hypothetical protein [Parcubacteria group bacterium]MBI2048953.1 hypothetical protein [Parcubacteria group bacterium]
MKAILGFLFYGITMVLLCLGARKREAARKWSMRKKMVVYLFFVIVLLSCFLSGAFLLISFLFF